MEALNPVIRSERAAPSAEWWRLLRDSANVGGATIICQLLGVVTSLALRALLDPARTGVWQGMKLLLSYGNYSNLGVSKGAGRELSIALGRGDVSGAARGTRLAYSASMVTSGIYAGLLLVAAFYAYRSGGEWSRHWTLGIGAIAGLCLLQRHVTFLVSTLRAQQEFRWTSRASVLEAVVGLGTSVLAVWLFGLPGVFISAVAVLLATWLLLRGRGAVNLGWEWDYAETKRLTMIGGPILLVGVASSFLRSLDKVMILSFMDDREHQLGYYSLALLVCGQIYGMANMLCIVLGPRLAEMVGRTSEPRNVANFAARTSELLAAVLGLTSAVAVLIGGPLLARLLPDYREGLPALAILAPGVVALGLTLPISQFLIAADRQRRALVQLLVATAIGFALTLIAISSGGGLERVAMATAASYAIYFSFSFVDSLWRELDAGDRLRYLVNVIGMGIVPPLLACLFANMDATVERCFYGVAASVAAWGIFALRAWRVDWAPDLERRGVS